IRASLVVENPHVAKEELEIKLKRSSRKVSSREALDQYSVTDKLMSTIDAQKGNQRKDSHDRKSEKVKEELLDSDSTPIIKLKEPLMILGMREKDARMAVTDNEKAQVYIAQIQRDIVQNWSRPPSARNGMQAQLRVFLVPTGEVIDVILEEESGNDAFDRSAVLAVNKAERFSVPSESRQFEKSFREFTILFRPEDLRL
ncbi:MAG: energy transducer TonB, partial [Candidatus Azotimanducaceae bacterium]